jgi:hypothetical protein
LASDLAVFRHYLENQGAELARTSEYLNYYAIPYIKNPKNHAALKQIFSPEWRNQLRKDLSEFLLRENQDRNPTFLERVWARHALKNTSCDNRETRSTNSLEALSSELLSISKEVLLKNIHANR